MRAMMAGAVSLLMALGAANAASGYTSVVVPDASAKGGFVEWRAAYERSAPAFRLRGNNFGPGFDIIAPLTLRRGGKVA